MGDVFLSYSRYDSDHARSLAAALEAHGLSVFWDRDIRAGAIFDQIIRTELDAASAVIVLWSRDSVGSDWVRDEAEGAKARGVLIPVLIDDVHLPLGFGRVQTADLRSWNGKPRATEISDLVAAVRAKLAGGREAPPLPGRGRPPPGRRRRRRWTGRLLGAAAAGLALVAVTAGALAALRYLEPGPVTSTPAGMVFLAEGEYVVGAPSSYVDRPGDAVEVVGERRVPTGEFWIERDPVTQSQFRAFVLSEARGELAIWEQMAPDDWLSFGGEQVITSSFPDSQSNDPVAGVSSLDLAEEYCEWTDRRLPTELEWEAAARSGAIGTGAVQEWVADAEDYGRVPAGRVVLRGGLPGLARADYERTVAVATGTLLRTAGLRCAADEVDDAGVDPCRNERAFAVWEPFCDPVPSWPDGADLDWTAGFHPADHYHLEASRPGTAVVALTDAAGDGLVETAAFLDPATQGAPDGIRYGLVVRAGGGQLVAFTVRQLPGDAPAPVEWRVTTREFGGGPVPSVVPVGTGDVVAAGTAARRDTAPVRLAVDQAGPELCFYVDGLLVHQGGGDAVAGGGAAGLIVESINADVAHVHFDYVGEGSGQVEGCWPQA